MQDLKRLLDDEIAIRNNTSEISEEKPDPLLVARKYNDEYISFICAMFSYGNASLIVKFLSKLDFSLLESSSENILNNDLGYYRFQSKQDVLEFFVTMSKFKKLYSLEKIFLEGFSKNQAIIDGIRNIITVIYDINPYRSKGYEFLIGKANSKGAYKRYNMYLRWMVRDDFIDLGLWKSVDKENLIIPLDTHTFRIAKNLGLIKRKTYDYKSAIELTNTLKKFDEFDPVKYDFVMYRLGQEKKL
ncbi:MAG: FIG00469843: hypothetical protein [uncultured Campylobacterales bacterium]|uniref:TIGR02757 family protein n=1 Tax=uncultured Campylobacterales bacterium TaxID=352960 RepID=A0A6S6TD59_9BACT|nr:MAG: FIG00469843: hypothetical protein [uncultured Campylobacterales bacterium]